MWNVARRVEPDEAEIAVLDTTERRTVVSAYAMRMFAVVFFSPLFAGAAFILRGVVDPGMLLSFSSNSSLGSRGGLLLIVDIVAVFYVHQLFHVFALRILGVTKVKTSLRGPFVVVAAPGWSLGRVESAVAALAPMVVISFIATFLLALLPASLLPWVFFPAVVNAAASGSDFITAAWTIAMPRDARISIEPDRCRAFLTRSY